MTLILPFSIGFPIQIFCHELLYQMSEINHMSEHSTSLKDRGNEEFKRGNFPMAIQLYSQYVLADNPDNEKAYTNLAMSHFKMGNYYPCIEACQKALLKDSTFAKAYYRLYLSYRELPNEDYNTFVNAHLFLRNFKEPNPASRLEALKVYNEFKDKFKSQKRQPANKSTSVLEDLLRNDCEAMQNEGEVGSVLGWEELFTSKKMRREEKLAKIQQEMEINPEGGVNLGYMYLNSIEKREEKKLVAERIHQIKDQLAERRRRQAAKDIKCEQMAQESSENLFQSEKQEQMEQQPISYNQQIRPLSSNQPEKVENPSEQESHTNIQAALMVSKPLQTPEQKSQTLPLPSQIERLTAKIEHTEETKQIALDAGYLARIPGRLSSSRDIFSTLEDIIMQVLQSNSSLSEKKSFLQSLPSSIREIGMIKSSFSTATQNKIYATLKQIGLQSLSPVYSPKGK